MTTQIIRGTNQQIADAVARMPERVVEAILLIENANETAVPPFESLTDAQFDALLKEMDGKAVSVDHVDDSREAIYSRREGE